MQDKLIFSKVLLPKEILQMFQVVFLSELLYIFWNQQCIMTLITTEYIDH